MTLDHIPATLTLDIIAAYTSVAFIVLLITLLTSSSVIWRKERLWNFSML
jgi:hypothetical protein